MCRHTSCAPGSVRVSPATSSWPQLGRKSSIHLSQRQELGTQADPNFWRRVSCELYSIIANVKLSLLWHQACAEKALSTIVLNYLKHTNLSQFRPMYGLIFFCMRVEGHCLGRCNGGGCREAPLGDTPCVPFLRRAWGTEWDLEKWGVTMPAHTQLFLECCF